MGSSMMVALSRATADGRTLLGHNSVRPGNEVQTLVRIPGRFHAPDEAVSTRHVRLPQVRHTFTVVGNRPAGEWGYANGINERGVAVGATAMFSRVECERPGLNGMDLARLVLERAGNALHGVDVATDLISRHGQGGFPGCSAANELRDAALLIADPREAYLVVAAGPHWAVQEIGAVRAVTNVCHLRQDWDRVSRGLADLVLKRGWWPEDGSKIDFEGTVCAGMPSTSGLRRLGHAMLLLEEQSGHIDSSFLRRVLSDHYEGCLDEVDGTSPSPDDNTICRHAFRPGAPCTAASFIAELGTEEQTVPLAWWAFGPACQSVYFPICVEGDLPDEFTTEIAGATDTVWRWMQYLGEEMSRTTGRRNSFSEALASLQERFDDEAREYMEEIARLRRLDPEDVHRSATAFMKHNVERFEELWLSLLEEGPARMGHWLASSPM